LDLWRLVILKSAAATVALCFILMQNRIHASFLRFLEMKSFSCHRPVNISFCLSSFLSHFTFCL